MTNNKKSIKTMQQPVILIAWLSLMCCSCNNSDEVSRDVFANNMSQYANILDIRYTPNDSVVFPGGFTDAGSWMGFTLPHDESWINGFCGPFSINYRYWMADCAVQVRHAKGSVASENKSYFDKSLPETESSVLPEAFFSDSVCYLPGECYMKSSSADGSVEQRLIFADATTALLTVYSENKMRWAFSAEKWNTNVSLECVDGSIIARHITGEILVITFDDNTSASLLNGDDGRAVNYMASTGKATAETHVALSFLTGGEKIDSVIASNHILLQDVSEAIACHGTRWSGYLGKVLRDDISLEYNRIAVKSLVTLISNWRVARGGLKHDGVVPSHAVGYFVGFWAWDSWRFSAALSRFAPELAKDNIRAMFDYQQPNGMIIDCIFVDTAENNYRDSKPPLVSWAVNEIFEQTRDTAFVVEMFPKLVAYYRWWYQKRDHDGNHQCEYGSTDGTKVAAAWESGMDNAIRFDKAVMIKNCEGAYSMNQESVDLNAYLALENRLLKKFSAIIEVPFEDPYYGDITSQYYFDSVNGFFFDRRLEDKSFIREEGCEAFTPLWTGIATKEQVRQMLDVLTDTTKFSVYIPFPTVAMDNPEYDAHGYWRGAIWLDQTHFAISGLRNYGYKEMADNYTRQVFDRLAGLKGQGAIYENYDASTGQPLEAPHFSWSAAHLLMLFEECVK
ncbi:MAG: trehalase family glycosidase [Bacteroidales bacterium]|nr:trehalase family glycosidase [Bacteroidales bacterium]